MTMAPSRTTCSFLSIGWKQSASGGMRLTSSSSSTLHAFGAWPTQRVVSLLFDVSGALLRAAERERRAPRAHAIRALQSARSSALHKTSEYWRPEFETESLSTDSRVGESAYVGRPTVVGPVRRVSPYTVV